MRYILIIGLFLTGCANPKKLHKMMDKLPEASAKECGQRYPIIESIDTITVNDTSLIQAYESEVFLLWKQLDSVLHAGCDTLYIDRIREIIKSKPAKVETKYIIKTQESTAKLQVAQDSLGAIINDREQDLIVNQYELISVKDTAEKRRKQRNKWRWLFIFMTIFAFRRQLLKLIS